MATRSSRAELAECRAALRAMAVELSQAEDQERARIARTLHDDMGQTLIAVQLRIAELQRAGTADRERITAELQALVRDAITYTRTLTYELMAPVMPEVGIEAELEQLAGRLMEKHGVQCHFETDDEPKPVRAEVAAALLRVVRELLYNIKKHSGAQHASLVVRRARGRIQLTVSDDGVGFQAPEPSAPERTGFGLLIVQERLAEIGGDIEIDSRLGTGTRVEITAPLLLGAGLAT